VELGQVPLIMELLEGVPLYSLFPHATKLYHNLLKTEILQNILVHVHTFVIVMTSVLFAFNKDDHMQNFMLYCMCAVLYLLMFGVIW